MRRRLVANLSRLIWTVIVLTAVATSRRELVTVIGETAQPAHASVWLRGAPR